MPMAPLTTMKLPAQKTMTTSTPSSANRRSRAVRGRPRRRHPGPPARTARRPPDRRASRSRGSSGRGRSDGFLVELEQLLVVLLGDLQPDEQPGQDRERDDDERGQGDPQCDGNGLERLHDYLLVSFLRGWTSVRVWARPRPPVWLPVWLRRGEAPDHARSARRYRRG